MTTFDKFLGYDYYLNSLKRQLYILLNKEKYTDEILYDHIRLAIIDICIIFGLDGNSPFPIAGIDEFLDKYKDTLKDIKAVRNDLLAHSFDPSTKNLKKQANHAYTSNLFEKYKNPIFGHFTTDLLKLITT